MQKSFISIVSIVISFLFVLAVPTLSSAQMGNVVKSPVSFHVEAGSLVCKSGSGTASVLFVTEPKAGGYFEIIGGAITQNGMTLDRRMSLKSGTYTWKGVANEGYLETPPSIGEFTIPVCGSSSASSLLVSPSKKQPTQVLSVPKETQKAVDGKEIGVGDTGTTTASLSGDTKENTAPETSQAGHFKLIIFALVVLGVVIGIFGLKNTDKKPTGN